MGLVEQKFYFHAFNLNKKKKKILVVHFLSCNQILCMHCFSIYKFGSVKWSMQAENFHAPYLKNFLKKLIAEIELNHDLVLDELYEQYAYYMTSLKVLLVNGGVI